MKVFQAAILAAVAQAVKTRDPDAHADMDEGLFHEEIGMMDSYMGDGHFDYSGYYTDYGAHYGGHDHHDDHHSDYHDSYSDHHTEHYSDHHSDHYSDHQSD